MNKTHRFNIGYLLAALLLLGAFQIWLGYRDVAEISYSEFLTLLDQHQITEVTVTETRITGRFSAPYQGKPYFATDRVEPALAELLAKAGAKVTGGSDSNWLTVILSWAFPILLMVGIWYFAFRQYAERQGIGGLMSVGKSKAKVYVETETGVTFADVAGVEEAKRELEEVVSFLKDKEKYGRLGAHVPKGILLVGPPGTGKTLLARAVAGEAGVPFFSISGSEFVEMFVGVGAARVRDLFDQARKAAPCIIFIDELDALGRARSPMGGLGGLDEKEQTLNQLLSELDGFDPWAGIVLLAATNRPEILDPALLRAGRFDRQIAIDRPDRIGRVAILRVHLKKVKVVADADPETIAGLTTGFTGADIANLVNEAAILATRRGGEGVSLDDFTRAVERIVAGSEMKSRLLNPAERERVAAHEMGHALVAVSLPGTDPVHKVSIIPRSIGALGYTMQRPTEDRFLITLHELKDRMTILMAGRAAEVLCFDDISTGAADDLAKVTDIARQIVGRFGMGEGTGQAVLEEPRPTYLGDNLPALRQRDLSDATAREVDLTIRKLIEEAFARAKELLGARMTQLRAGTALLLERETITPEDFAPLRPSKPAREGRKGA